MLFRVININQNFLSTCGIILQYVNIVEYMYIIFNFNVKYSKNLKIVYLISFGVRNKENILRFKNMFLG